MTKIRKALVTAALFIGAVLGAQLGFGGGIPNIPSSPQFSEPSQIIGTLNAFINQLNGNPLGSGGYAAQPGGAVSIGSFAQPAAGATPLTANTTRGFTQFTGVTVTNAATATVVINNSLITAASVCPAWVVTGTNAAQSTPFVSTATPGTGTLTVILGNGSATSTGASTIGVAFTCIQ